MRVYGYEVPQVKKVRKNQNDLVEIKHELHQVLCIKG